MKANLNQLKKNDPLLVWYSNKEIEEIISFLHEEGFTWSNAKRALYNENLELVILPKDIRFFIDNKNLLYKKIEEGKINKSEKKEDFLGNIKVAGYLINFLVFLAIINFFLGWIFFHFLVWLFLEVGIVFLLISFIKIKKKINKKVQNYVS